MQAKTSCRPTNLPYPKQYRPLVSLAIAWLSWASGTWEANQMTHLIPSEDGRTLLAHWEEALALNDFETELDSLKNTPRIHNAYLDTNDQFTMVIGWFANANLTLQKSTQLTEESWQSADNFSTNEDGGSVYYVKDDEAFSGGSFYRVASE